MKRAAGILFLKYIRGKKEKYVSKLTNTRTRIDASKVFKPTVLRPGDQVLYEKYGTTKVELDGKEVVLVHESDVLGWLG
ncbi:MAG TPA: hypothetical protein DDX84_09425 [Nitrospiraceae bacterium]|nr:hypothetical protein [Nitrospiraceae bacterium]